MPESDTCTSTIAHFSRATTSPTIRTCAPLGLRREAGVRSITMRDIKPGMGQYQAMFSKRSRSKYEMPAVFRDPSLLSYASEISSAGVSLDHEHATRKSDAG